MYLKGLVISVKFRGFLTHSQKIYLKIKKARRVPTLEYKIFKANSQEMASLPYENHFS